MEFITRLSPEDYSQIDEIYWKHHANDFGIPNLEHTVTHAVVRDGSELIAFGMVKLIPEAILIMNKDSSLRNRVAAWRALMAKAVFDTRAERHKFLYATIHDDAYSNLLRKHYQFLDVPGKQVSLEL